MKRNGRNPAMAKGVEFTNIPIFEVETFRMPIFVFHELAHAYHEQVLGFNNRQVVEAFKEAERAGSYEKVKRAPTRPGRRETVEKAYAISNPMEYFAETSEAYFGRNDYFPFNNEELKEHDPDMFSVLEEVWGVSKDE